MVEIVNNGVNCQTHSLPGSICEGLALARNHLVSAQAHGPGASDHFIDADVFFHLFGVAAGPVETTLDSGSSQMGGIVAAICLRDDGAIFLGVLAGYFLVVFLEDLNDLGVGVDIHGRHHRAAHPELGINRVFELVLEFGIFGSNLIEHVDEPSLISSGV